MAIEDMHNAARCRHVRLSGRQCKAPARCATNYCVFHEAEHSNSMKISFPPIEDAASVAVATNQVIQALRDDLIDYRRAALLFAGLRIARANLKQLAVEIGDVEPPNKSCEDEDDLPGPSLAEILLQRLNEMEAESAAETRQPAPAPVDIAEAKVRGRDLAQLLLDRLGALEEPEEERG